MNPTNAVTPTAVWPTFRYKDTDAAIRFLVDILGFQEVAVYRHEPTQTVDHAELRWPGGGGVMLGTARPDRDLPEMVPGAGAVYIVTDDPDSIYERAKAAGATIALEMREEDYGSKGFTVRDAEGVFWSFGTYGGQEADAPVADKETGRP